MRHSAFEWLRLAAFALTLGAAPMAAAQQAIITPAATQPGAGRFTIREVARYISLDDDPTPLNRSGYEFRMTTEIAVGITGSLSLEGEIPIAYRDIDGAPGASIDGVGFPDFTVRAKWRVWKEDFGPLDTGRLSLFGGLKIRSGDSDFTSDSYDPIFGAVYTQITGRHGFNLAAQYRLTTGSNPTPLLAGDGKADQLRGDASYLYRISPASFAESSHDAWYAVMEFNSSYETNGDLELFLSPGILYEASTWALEAGVQIPIAHSLDYRPRVEIAARLGVRFLF